MGRLNQMHSIVIRPKKGNAPIMIKIPKTNANEIKKRNSLRNVYVLAVIIPEYAFFQKRGY